MSTQVDVVGGGVIGLSTAVVLAEHGHQVRIWSREEPEATTSAVAGGLWWPYRIEPEELVGDWSLASLRVYEELAKDPEETGVRLVPGVMAETALSALGPWGAAVPELREATTQELRSYGHGLRARLPLIDMPVHLRYLRRRLESAGGVLELRTVTDLDAVGTVVVNCSGLGARTLVPDTGMRPVRGQLVIVENPGVDEWFVAAGRTSSETSYLLPHPYGLVLGGTAEEDAWDLVPDPATAAAIVERCARIRPEVAGARVLDHRVGLRPARDGGVRLEAERRPSGALWVHNYGHGGAGVTVAWGCAETAARLVR
ncbi:FAD-dependent oxidoreductase [Streptomyces sannanensis]|uniref:D-amino-acid oxidase n=1 Tax=Streptomyces sannanensis TaxID=285536 RepID=A0ABP6SK34_9ACTN